MNASIKRISLHRCVAFALGSLWLSLACSNTDGGQSANPADAASRVDAGDAGSTPARPPPPGCEAVKVGLLRNGTQLTPATYGQQPTLRGLLESDLGAPAIQDTVRLVIAHPAETGTFSFAGDNAQALTCEQCLIVLEDDDDAKGTVAHAYLAVDGQVTLDARTSPEELEGKLDGVKLVEVTFAKLNAPYSKTALVPNGKCIWIDTATFSSKVAGGCDPLAGATACTGGACFPQNSAATDGLCVASTGSKSVGTACKLAANGDSDCAPSLVCAGKKCRSVCDFKSENPGCPAPTHCAPGGVCLSDSEAYGNKARDTAKIGQPCVVSGSEACGVDGALGICNDIDGEAGPAPRLCYALARSRSECNAGEFLGYLAAPHDLSLGFCYTPTEPP